MSQVALALIERAEQRIALQMAPLPPFEHPGHALL
jgi:hypothetical protein